MPEKVTKEEKLIEVAIMKAKEVLQEFQDGTTVMLDEDVMGEDIKLKRPKKNPSEEKIKNPTGDEGYGYIGKAIMKESNPFLDDERDRNLKLRIERIQGDIEEVEVELDEMDISGAKDNPSLFTRQSKLQNKLKNLQGQLGDAYDALGKAVMLKRMLKAAEAIDLVSKMELDSIVKSKMDDLKLSIQAAFEKFMASPMKDADQKAYEREYLRLKKLIDRFDGHAETEMDAEHSPAAHVKRKYGYRL
tara:strand:+ start:8241 stop:8978 length:738 start_codon:yes stop_codon:yes gene_type:complete